jgi:pimeloyl-ACP methyl ester carboxylesterase
MSLTHNLTSTPAGRDWIGTTPEHPVVEPGKIAAEAVLPEEWLFDAVPGPWVDDEHGGDPEPLQRSEKLRPMGLRHGFAKHSPVVRWFNPDKAKRLLTEPGARRLDLYFAFVGDDIEFFIGGEVARFPDFRPQLKQLRMPVLILAGRFDRALYPKLQMDFKRFCPQARFMMLERSGTFGHLEEPETVMPLLREFLAP